MPGYFTKGCWPAGRAPKAENRPQTHLPHNEIVKLIRHFLGDTIPKPLSSTHVYKSFMNSLAVIPESLMSLRSVPIESSLC